MLQSYVTYGWLVVSTPLKNMSSSVGIIPNIWKVKKLMFQTSNQMGKLTRKTRDMLFNSGFFWHGVHGGMLNSDNSRGYHGVCCDSNSKVSQALNDWSTGSA